MTKSELADLVEGRLPYLTQKNLGKVDRIECHTRNCDKKMELPDKRLLQAMRSGKPMPRDEGT